MKKRPFKKNYKKAKFLIRHRKSGFPVEWEDITIVSIDLDSIDEDWLSVWHKISLALLDKNINQLFIHKSMLVGINKKAKIFSELLIIKNKKERKTKKKIEDIANRKRIKAYLKKKRKK